MADFLLGASLITAFIAGMAALFAPCCITVLLPAYLGSVFRQRATIFLMTFVFFLGLLTVFLPLGLGIAALGEFFAQFHDTFFILGGVFLALLGAMILLGIHASLPFSVAPKAGITGIGSVYVLGIFSGFATMCCAPVLAGVLALAVLPGSVLLGGLYSLAYVLGMVAPLFLISYFADKTSAVQKMRKLNKPICYNVLGREVRIRLSDAIAGTMFLLMGAFTIYLAQTGGLQQMSASKLETNILMASLTQMLQENLSGIPDYAIIAITIAIAAVVVYKAMEAIKKGKKTGGIE
ncbi:MAG: cytochrome c biogenesis CcdA family protein [archaeon]|nr:cytochrome c biogenesis CcdA family protein [archaeon]